MTDPMTPQQNIDRLRHIAQAGAQRRHSPQDGAQGPRT